MKIQPLPLFLILLVPFCPGFQAQCQPELPVIKLIPNQPELPIGRQVLVLRDPTQSLTLADVTTGKARVRFRQSTQAAPNFGTTNDDAWACFRFQNNLPNNQTPVLEIGFTNYDRIDLFIIDSVGSVQTLTVGDRVNGHAVRNMPGQTYAIRLPLQSGQVATIYVHLHTTIGQQYFPLLLWHETAYIQSITDANIMWGSYYGIFLLVILYHLFVFATTRDWSYGYLLGYLLLFAFWELGRGYNLFHRLDIPLGWVASKLMPTAYMGSFLLLTFFYERMLQVHRYLPHYSYLRAVIASLLVGGVLSVWLVPNAPKNLILMGTVWPSGLIILITSGYTYLQKPQIARFYVMAISALWSGATVYMLQRTGVIESEFWMIKYGVNVGSLLEFVFLTLGMADSMRYERRERRLLREEAIRKESRAEAEHEYARLQGQTIERKRISYELHNNLGGSMYGLRLLLRRIQPTSLTPAEQEVYKTLTNTLKQTHEAIRLISHNLMPDQLSQQGLSVTLNRLIADLNQLGTTNFEVRLLGSVDAIPNSVQFELYTILLELAQNILRHAEAESASVQVRATETDVQLQVSDDGRGIDPLVMASVGDGQGLRTIRERVEALNGTFQVKALPEGGTYLRVTLPLESTNTVPVGKVDQAHHRANAHLPHEVASVGFNRVFADE